MTSGALLIVAAAVVDTELPRDPAEFRWVPPVLHATGLFVTMRVSEALLWPTPFAESPRGWPDYYREAYTRPPKFDSSRRPFEWDGDRWFINVLGHGLLGSELYLRARQCHANFPVALLFTAGASATWEYVFEANGVRPSALDLVYTPVAGLVFGELRFLGYRAAASASPTVRGIVRAVLDPLGQLERLAGSPC